MNDPWTRVKQWLIGSPIASAEHERQLLPKVLALPVFASDPLSSVAYATEEITLVLALAGGVALRFIVPVSVAIGVLMAVVVVSYRQTVRAYPDGGGAFIVANDNLGRGPAMVAAASLLTDYVLTVAVSIAAGMAAVTSAVPSLLPHRVLLALVAVLLLTVANLRGVREAGTLFAAPTYAFVLVVLVTLGVGYARCLAGSCPQAVSAGAPLAPMAGVSLFLVLRAFASGASALTGTEAIANGVQAFRPPKPANAARTLGWMGVLAITMFLGISGLARLLDVRVSDATIGRYGTVLSQIGRAVFGGGAGFAILQAATAAILVLAANTAYQDFPRLSAILAAHRLMPRQYRHQGDRLAFSNGIVTVSVLAGVLIVVFGADVSRLIQLYVVGVFTSFTLSQTGMVRHWLRTRERGWRRSVVINAVGALVTGVVLVVVAWMKFTHGAWIILVAVPLFVAGMARIRRHYLWVASRLRQIQPIDCTRPLPHRVIVLASKSGKHLDRALRYARLLHANHLETWHVREAGDRRLRVHWQERYADISLTVLEAGPGGIAATLRRHLRVVRELDPDTMLTVVVAEHVGARRWRHAFAHRTGGLGILWALRGESGVAVTAVNYWPAGHPRTRHHTDPLLTLANRRLVHMAGTALDVGTGQGGPFRRVETIVLVSEVTAPTLRAVRYACTITPGAVRALHVEIEPEQRTRVEAAWRQLGVEVPLEVVPSPYRDLTATVLGYIDRAARRAGPEVMLNVVIPEFVVPSLLGKALHNQSALWILGALYADTRVAVTSVPWALEDIEAATPSAPPPQSTTPA
jgi:amino acid transporter